MACQGTAAGKWSSLTQVFALVPSSSHARCLVPQPVCLKVKWCPGKNAVAESCTFEAMNYKGGKGGWSEHGSKGHKGQKGKPQNPTGGYDALKGQKGKSDNRTSGGKGLVVEHLLVPIPCTDASKVHEVLWSGGTWPANIIV